MNTNRTRCGGSCFCILLRRLVSHLGQGEGKLRVPVLAGDGDVLLVGVEDGLDDVQAQAHALLVGGTGAVGLVEAVEDVAELVRGNGLPLVADGDVGLAAPGADLQRQLPPPGRRTSPRCPGGCSRPE